MKVLLPTMRDPGQIGGTSTHLDMLSAGLVELGHEPYVLYFGERVPEPLRRFGVVYAAGVLNRVRRGWGMIYSAMVRGRLVARLADRELRRHDWQVVNAQEVYSVPALREAADRAGVPLVLTLHGYPLYESVSEGYTTRSRLGRRYLMRSEIRALRLADAIVTVDGRLYRHVLRLVPERADVTYSLMNFIDTSAFSPTVEGREELRRKWDIPEEKTVLFCPRRLVKKNGVIYPSLALAEMEPSEREQYLLLHAGDGGERGAIEQIVREQGLEAQVRLLGGLGREAIEELYRLCDIVLVPSVHSEKVEEATSLSALEAMASGRPLIAGAVGGLAEMVSDGVNGLLVPAADPEASAAAILRLSADPDLGARLAQTARNYVVENHSHLRAAASYADIYRAAADAVGSAAVDARGAAASTVDTDAAGASMAPRTSTPAAPRTPAPATASTSAPPAPVLSSISGSACRSTRSAWTRPPSWSLAGRPPLRGAAPAWLSPSIRSLRYAPKTTRRSSRLCWPPTCAFRTGSGWCGRRAAAESAACSACPVSRWRNECSRALPRRPGRLLLGSCARRGRAGGRDVRGALRGPHRRRDPRRLLRRRRDPGRRGDGALLGRRHPPGGHGRSPAGTVRLPAPRRTGRAGSVGSRWELRRVVGTGAARPAWTRVLGVEWLYRLLTDPRRLRRQLALPVFARRVLTDVASDYHRPRG